MKTINLKRVTNTLSEKEMKSITGGGDLKKDSPLAPDPCSGSKVGDKCTFNGSSSVEGICNGTFDGKVVCVKK